MSFDGYVESIKKAAVSLATKSALTYIYASLPFLKLPVISFITETIVKKIITAGIDSAEVAVFFKYTDLRVNKQGMAFVEAAQKHNLEKDPELKKVLEKDLIEKFKAFASFTN